MKVLLTGANGLLGQNVLRQLLNENHEVVALVRRASSLQQFDNMVIKEGSFIEADILREAAKGCDAIVNVAGTTDMSLLSYGDYLPVNKNGVEVILQIMEEHGIKRLVHVSTANTIGYGSPDQPADEEAEMTEPFRQSFYARSKAEGEQLLHWETTEHPDWHIVIVNPGFMIGPYDTRPSSGQLLDAAYGRKRMVCPSGGKSFVYVKDAAVAIVNALTMGRNGENYLLTGKSISLHDFYVLQASLCGYKQQVMVLPDWLVLAAGYVGDLLQMLKIKTQLCTRNVRQLLVNEYYSNLKARQELLMPQTPIEEAIRAYFDWKAQKKETSIN